MYIDIKSLKPIVNQLSTTKKPIARGAVKKFWPILLNGDVIDTTHMSIKRDFPIALSSMHLSDLSESITEGVRFGLALFAWYTGYQHPVFAEVIKTYSEKLGIEIVER